MPSYNRVLLMGNLTRDPELRYTPNNTAVCQLGIAVNHRWKDQNGEQKEEVTFVDCDAWGRTAEVINQYLRKGKPIFIEGRLKLDQWQDKEGNNRSKLKVVVENFQFVDSRADGAAGGPPVEGGGGRSAPAGNRPAPRAQQGQQGPPPQGGAPMPQEPQQPVEEDIPF